jgi:hypothetical protein
MENHSEQQQQVAGNRRRPSASSAGICRLPGTHLALEYLTMISACTHLGRQGLRFANDCLEVVILPGGGHIAKVALLSGPSAGSNPLWELPWPTVDPSLRRAAILQTDVYGTDKEGELLCSIAGHNLAADVFGAQSKGEQEKSGLCFHGEAGLVQWEVETASIVPGGGVELTMAASLPESQLRIGRVFDLKPGSHTVKCTETITNLTGFQRAGGRAQHVTIGSEWLQSAGGCRFACNADRGMTWPDEVDDGTWKQATEFNYPFVPKKKSGATGPKEAAMKMTATGECTQGSQRTGTARTCAADLNEFRPEFRKSGLNCS